MSINIRYVMFFFLLVGLGSMVYSNVQGVAVMKSYADISSGQDANSGANPSAVVDTVNAKLLVATWNMANSGKPGLFRCNLDGASCTYSDISVGQESSGLDPSAVLDVVNRKLLVVTTNQANANKPGLFRCNLDGTSCTYADISAGQRYDSGFYPSAVIDYANDKLLVATWNMANSGKPGLFRCNLDGTSCAYIDISAGQGENSGYFPSAVIDAANGKLLVTTTNGANGSKPGLFRCNLNGTSCTHVDISAGQRENSGFYPSAVVDVFSAKLFVVTQNIANDSKPGLFRCNLDGTSCTHTDISAGQGSYSGKYPSAVLKYDSMGFGKLHVATWNIANKGKPGLFECNLDGTACTHTDMLVGQGANSGLSPSVVYDAASKRVLVVTENGSNERRLGLFTYAPSWSSRNPIFTDPIGK
jgi:hypothetical protein